MLPQGERLVGTRGSGARKEVPQQNIGEGASVPAQPQFDSSQRVEDEAGAPGEPRALEAVVYEGEVCRVPVTRAVLFVHSFRTFSLPHPNDMEQLTCDMLTLLQRRLIGHCPSKT
jgi:hypothetical protein